MKWLLTINDTVLKIDAETVILTVGPDQTEQGNNEEAN